MIKFKIYREDLIEARIKGESAYLEMVIVQLVKFYREFPAFEDFKTRISKNRPVMRFIKQHSKFKLPKNLDEAAPIFYKFVKDIDKNIGSSGGVVQVVGSDYPAVSSFWQQTTGKSKDVSKTDILIGNDKVSVKKAKSQLMSGNKTESLATLESAFKESSLSNELETEIREVIQKLANRTETIGLNATELSSINIDDIKTDTNRKAKLVYDDARQASIDVRTIMGKALKKKSFRTAFAFEAVSGWEKFGGKTFGSAGGESGHATKMLVVPNDFSTIKYYDITSSSSSKINQIATKMTLEVNMKSSSFMRGTGDDKHKRYAFYSTFRLGLNSQFKKLNEDLEGINDEVALLEGMSGDLSEKISDLYIKLKNKISSYLTQFTDFIKKVLGYLKELLVDGLTATLEFFDTEISSISSSILV